MVNKEIGEKVLAGMDCCLPESDDPALTCSNCPYASGLCGDISEAMISFPLEMIEDMRKFIREALKDG